MPDENERSEYEDPFLDEVRALRRDFSARFDHDLDKLCDHLEEIESRHAGRISHRRTVASEPTDDAA